LDIEDLVQRASATSADTMPATKPTSVTQAQVARAVTPRLGAVLEEIELAAKNARTRSAMQRTTVTTTAKSISSPSSPTTASDVKPLVIEIYRRPRVQVFRRRDGDFERK
jgi:branched-chain amino acid transport system ATP-binding protein